MLVKAVLWHHSGYCLTCQAEAETGGLSFLYLCNKSNMGKVKIPSYRQNNICLQWLKITGSFAEERSEHGLWKKVRGQSLSWIYFISFYFSPSSLLWEKLCWSFSANMEPIHMASWPFFYIMALSWIEHEMVRYDSPSRVHRSTALMLPMEHWPKAGTGLPLNIFSLAFMHTAAGLSVIHKLYQSRVT